MAVNTYLAEVPPEINNPSPGAMLIVGRDPGYEEVREGRPLLGEDGRLLFSLLRSHGIHREQVNITTVVRCKPYENDFSRHRAVLVQQHAKDLAALIDRLQPGVIVACGNEAAYTLVPEWPSKDHSVFRATGIKKRRGYWWSGKSPAAHKIVTTLNPSAALPFKDPSGISHMLLAHDLGVAAKEQLERGAKRLHRPYRKVHIVLKWKQAEIAKNAILQAGVVAADIENYTKGDHHLRCIAIATSASESYVFPPSQFPAVFELLQDARVKTIWQNGQYDLQFLLQKEGVKVAAFHDDTIIQWHTLKPEVAGAAKDHLGRKRGSKQTAKGLAFLASIYSPFTPWWKCVEENTPVLMADFSWKAIKDVEVGEKVWAFDEEVIDRGKRRWRAVSVIAKNTSKHTCLRVKTTKGDLILTPEHRVIARSVGQSTKWSRADELRIGDMLRHVSSPTVRATSFDAGWLSGMADGEGSIRYDASTNSGGAITISQKRGPVLDKIIETCKAHSFDVGVYGKRTSDVANVYIKGGRPEWVRFLSLFNPTRLVQRTSQILEGMVFSCRAAEILSVESVDDPVNVVDIATEAGTFVANGFAVHNSYNFTHEREAWELCGRDTCLTYECRDAMHHELAEDGLEGIHTQTLTRVWPVVMILNRGMVVNEALRLERLEQLREQRELQLKRITAVASPIIEANRDCLAKPHLFFRRKICSCCKNGKKQREACASCFGVSGSARKGELQAAARKHILAQKLEPHLTVRALEEMQKLTAADLKATYLKPCRECEGVGEWEELWFNPGSEQQVKDLLFNALKLPRASKSDEATLKNLLAYTEEKIDE